DELLEFSAVGLIERQEALSGQLLRQRAGALRPAALPEVRNRRADDADGVDAAMLVEPLVFNRENGLSDEGRHLVQGYLDPLLLEDREGRPPVQIEKRRRLRHVADTTEHVPLG